MSNEIGAGQAVEAEAGSPVSVEAPPLAASSPGATVDVAPDRVENFVRALGPTEDEPPFAVCFCGAPLIGTMVWPKAEFYCLECGQHFGWMGPQSAKWTPELAARYEAIRAEWDEHAGPFLFAPHSWHRDCEHCEGHREYHSAHATDDERARDREAREWLAQRVGRTPTTGEGS